MPTTPYGYQQHFAVISATSSGNTTIVPAVTGMKIRVVSCYFISSNTNTVTFLSGSTSLSGAMDFTSQERLTLPASEYGWMETSSGQALVLSLSASNKIAGMLCYFLT